MYNTLSPRIALTSFVLFYDTFSCLQRLNLHIKCLVEHDMCQKLFRQLPSNRQEANKYRSIIISQHTRGQQMPKYYYKPPCHRRYWGNINSHVAKTDCVKTLPLRRYLYEQITRLLTDNTRL